MGTVIKRFAVLAVAGVLLAPGLAAADTTYGPGPDYKAGPAGGSEGATMTEQNTETGELSAFQFQFSEVSGNLGCEGQGPFAFFDVDHEAVLPVAAVTVDYTDALVSPYAFMKLSLLQGDAYVDTEIAQVGAPIIGDGSFTLELAEPLSGDMTARFGIEVSSNCPSVDGGMATFTEVTFVESDAD